MARTTSADVEQRLLRAAARHFAADGLERASVDAIAADAGVAKGTVYNYFDSKEALFAGVLAESARRAVARYEAAPAGWSVRDQLLALAEADCRVLAQDEGFHRVLVREALSARPETYSLVLEHLAPFVQAVERIVEQGVATGEVRADRSPGELALLFVGTLALLYVAHWGSQGGWPTYEELPGLAVTAFLDGAGRAAPLVPTEVGS